MTPFNSFSWRTVWTRSRRRSSSRRRATVVSGSRRRSRAGVVPSVRAGGEGRVLGHCTVEELHDPGYSISEIDLVLRLLEEGRLRVDREFVVQHPGQNSAHLLAADGPTAAEPRQRLGKVQQGLDGGARRRFRSGRRGWRFCRAGSLPYTGGRRGGRQGGGCPWCAAPDRSEARRQKSSCPSRKPSRSRTGAGRTRPGWQRRLVQSPRRCRSGRPGQTPRERRSRRRGRQGCQGSEDGRACSGRPGRCGRAGLR